MASLSLAGSGGPGCADRQERNAPWAPIS